MSNDIYCESCKVRPKEQRCDWCNAHICNCCHEVHKCPDQSHDVTAIMHEAQQSELLSKAVASIPTSARTLDTPEIQVLDQMNAMVQKEEDLIIAYYKEQHDKLSAQHSELQASNESLQTKLKDLEIQYAQEVKTIIESCNSQVANQVATIQQNAESVIAQHAARNQELEAQIAELNRKTDESLKKKLPSSPRSPINHMI